MNEIWKKIVEYPDYAVSSHGRIKRIAPTWNGSGKTYVGKILKPYVDRLGYCRVNLSKISVPKRFLVSRIVAIEFLKNSNEKRTHVAHIDGNPRNNHVSNLRWSTPKENMADKKRHGTHPDGEKNHKTTLTEKQVKEIYASKEKYSEIEKKYNISQACVSDIKNGRRWTYLRLKPKSRRLLPKQVIEIISSQESAVILSKKHCVTETQIHRIRNGKCWKALYAGVR